MIAIVGFLVAHWVLSIFCQTFFLHRYASHRMFTLSKGWERFFHVFSWVCMGPSFLVPRAYAVLHRMHHAYSDTPKDPHSPRHHGNVFRMMWETKKAYHGLINGEATVDPKFAGNAPDWPAFDRFTQRWSTIVGFGALYFLYYLAFAPSAWFFLLLPVHWLMGPIHGAIVNWFGHRVGYRNFTSDDDSRNTLPFDFVTMGELFQNNHHQFARSPNFAARRFEIDPTWAVIRVLAKLRVLDLGPRPRLARFDEDAAVSPAE